MTGGGAAMVQVCCRYDGTFAGFLTCVFECYAHHECPAAFLTDGDAEETLWPERPVDTDRPRALRVYKALAGQVSPAFRQIIEKGFLTCLPQREVDLYALIRRGLDEGDRVRRDLTDPTVARVMLAIRKLDTEVDHLKGFVRFSDVDGVLAGEIQPKNRVLPLLARHFSARLSGERVALFDRTHREALFCGAGRWKILPVEEFEIGPGDETERAFRALWRRFFRTISIQERHNPRCQMTHLPKRYRGAMLEFQAEEPPLSEPEAGSSGGIVPRLGD